MSSEKDLSEETDADNVGEDEIVPTKKIKLEDEEEDVKENVTDNVEKSDDVKESKSDNIAKKNIKKKKPNRVKENTKIKQENSDEDVEVNEVKEEKNDESDEEDIDEIKKKGHLTTFFKKRDNLVNQIYQSKVPEICKNEPCQLGVDEAGRGPVLGPMLYGIAYAPLSKKKLLVELGCADSKSLTEEKRDIIFDKICDNSEQMGWAVDSISPNYISNSMYRRSKTSLNEVSMNSAINLIKKSIEAGVFVAEIYVDTVGKPEKYQAKLEGIFPGIKITVAKKADSTYPIVSAASICAKVSRDHALRAWQFMGGGNKTAYGSGYPNDPVTKTWLTENIDPIFGFPLLVRFSWSTAEKILESKAASVEWEEPEEETLDSGMKISNFFSPSATNKKPKENIKKKHIFFSHRCLLSTTEL